jgi:calcineurin-like phosphoesterase
MRFPCDSLGDHSGYGSALRRDEPKGTDYITDIGMTGSSDSVLGRVVENVLKSFGT